ncbi:Hpt domain-containing protein [Leptothrix ochracea]|uniref:hybrid sensor histidine kinase/response regulator n=1 Tax=Leptothrix ochracea TaxID=735331 RepID=UPI0034E1C655
MQSHNDTVASADLSAIAWVQEELRKTLETAHKALRRYLRDSETTSGADLDDVEPAVLRHARQHIHQGVGALELINLPEGAQLLRACEAMVQRYVGKPYRLNAEGVAAIERATFALMDYLARLLAGKPTAPLALFPQLRVLLEAVGSDRIHPADLWNFEWEWRAIEGPTKPPRAPEAVILDVFEKRLLAVVRSDATEGVRSLAMLCQGLASTADSSHAATSWRIASAFFEAWAWGHLTPDLFTKRTASRVMGQLRAMIKGEKAVSDRLAQDLLFFCARAGKIDPVQTPVLAAVHATYALSDPANNTAGISYIQPTLGLFDPVLVQQGMKRVEAAKEVWAAVAADELQRMGSLNELFTLVGDSIRRLYPNSETFVAALLSAVSRTVAAGAKPAPELAMEVATSLLYLEASLEEAEFDAPELSARVATLATRLDSVIRGRSAGAVETWMEELYRRISNRQTMNTVVKELRQSLSDVEQQIDRFFRNPKDPAPLVDVPVHLMAMRGVLSVLGMDPGSQTVARMRDDVQGLTRRVQDGAAPDEVQSGFQRLADNLGVLGFLIDMLAVQPQMARSLFVFDPAKGVLSPVMGRQTVAASVVTAATPPAPVITAAPPAPVVVAAPAPVPAPVARILPPLEGVPPPVPAPVVAPPPVIPATVAVQDDAAEHDDGDAEMREIFIEEAREVVTDGHKALQSWVRAPSDVSLLSPLRRAFHTLKGSSRMVGLTDYGDAAWSCEQLYNKWLAEPSSSAHDLQALTGDALTYFGAWTEAIAERRAQSFQPETVIAAADALRLAGELLRIHVPTMSGVGPRAVVEAMPPPYPPIDVDVLDLEVAFAADDRPVMEALEPTQPAPLDEIPPIGAATSAYGSALAPDFDLDLDFNLGAVEDVPMPVESAMDEAAVPVEMPEWTDLPILGGLSQLGDLVDLPPAASAALEQDTSAASDFPSLSGLSQLADLIDPAPMPAAGASAVDLSDLPQLQGLSQLGDLLDPLPIMSSGVSPLISGAQEDVPHTDFPTLSGLSQLAAWHDDPVGPTAASEAETVASDLLALPPLEGLSGLSDVVMSPPVEAAALPPAAVVEQEAPVLPPPAVSAFAPSDMGDPMAAVLGETLLAPPVDLDVSDFDAFFAADPTSAVPLDPAPARVSLNPVDDERSPDAEESVEAVEAVEGVTAMFAPSEEDADDVDDEQVRVIGSLRLPIPLFNIYLNEADELSRRLSTELAEWALELHRPTGVLAASLAHKLAGNSAAVGFTDLSQLARELEHAIDRVNARNTAGRLEEASLFIEVGDEVRRLLHQFAAGFLRVPPDGLFGRLKGCAHDVDVAAARAAERAVELSTDFSEEDTVVLAGAKGSSADDGDFVLPDVVIDTGMWSEFATSKSEPEAIDVSMEFIELPAPEPASESASAGWGHVTVDPPGLTNYGNLPAQAVAGETVMAWPVDLDLNFDAEVTTHLGVTEDAAVAPAEALESAAASDDMASTDIVLDHDMGPSVTVSPETIHDIDNDAVALFDREEGPIDHQDVVDDQLFHIFVEEADELIPVMAEQLRSWQADPVNSTAAMACMRSLHTFKGGARLAGAMRLGEKAHRFESAIERLLAGGVVSVDDLEILQQRLDVLASAFEALRRHNVRQENYTMLAGLYDPSVGSAANFVQTSSTKGASAPLPRVASAVPAVRSEGAGAASPAPGTMSTVVPLTTPVDWSQFTAQQQQAAVAPQTTLPDRPVGNLQPIRVRAQLLDRLVNLSGEVNINRSRVETEVSQFRGALTDLSDNLERLHRQLNDITIQADTQLESRREAFRVADQAFDSLEMDRYTRLQELTRMMAESVNDVGTVRSALQRTLQVVEDELATQARLTRELQSDLLRTRMVEFDSLSDRLYRLVRQAAKETGKQVRLDITGSSIEVDRSVLDRMVPAFEHLLRNCVTHGIEPSAARVAAGKPAVGSITVSAGQEGGEVTVEIHDDGHGLDLPRIREKAISMGLLRTDAVISDADLSQFIFAPGLSTQSVVTELAGRGVGMDVVRADIFSLGGRIEIDTQPGQGTRFKMVLPVTTVVSQIVMLRVGTKAVAIPSNLIEKIERPGAASLAVAYQSGWFAFDNAKLPFFWLGGLLGHSARSEDEASSKTQSVVVVRSAQQRVVMHVDEVLGNHEVVVKNLGPQLSGLPGLAGMTLLASGEVALIYNPVALAAFYGAQAQHAAQQGAMAEAHVSAVEVRKAAAEVTHHATVLVVDDSLTVRRVTKRLLEREGFRVELAKDGLEALEFLAGQRPDIVLSDIEMPRMDGFDLLRNIRNDANLKSLPVVMITSRIAEKHREHATQLGADHYLGKPYDDKELLGLVRRYAGLPPPPVKPT